jgi:4-amino-4-deoxy-L-arabinose transferase-like glycosyltransferase
MEEPKKQERQEVKKEKTIADRIIDFIFSNSEKKWLLLIFLLGVILRFLVSSNISLLVDEAVHGPHIMGFLDAGLISTFTEAPLWFFLGDIFLKILGITIFSLRFTSFIFGSISILLVYLIAKRIFNKKIALISSFLLSVSFFTIRYTLIEMDLSCLFFLLLAIYYFIVSVLDNSFM